ncbi:hypothetical protein [Arthrobacter sp. EPSL27]|uniref:hypothetical protein n=1 Tax=Arthrobacter sp. EPSL27 TaxID=1745378 RepID=UPI00074A79B0|nr:hypothetical protein [Arthrobacter sp. EPSL27]KUM33670.1 hypothetical protein AR539_17350 [Arthrobacter sp. EPSL27]
MSTPEISGTPDEQHVPERREITVRRAPKYVPFLVLGGLVGFGVAAFLAYGLPGDESFDSGAVFGFFMILCGAGGVILGGIVALVLDRMSVRRAKRAVVESVPDSEPDAEDRPGA